MRTLHPSLEAPTIAGRIEAAARVGGRIVFIDGDDHDPVTWAQLHDEARSMAAAMQARGIGAGDHVALLGPTSRMLVTAVEATWLAGACLVMLPLPMRMSSIEAFIAATRRRIDDADAKVVLLDSQFAEFIDPQPDDVPMIPFDELLPAEEGARVDPDAFVRPADDPDSLALLQFTSGSTSEPKGVMLTQRAICANLSGAIEVAGILPGDTLVSWLPLYHDMGLIGLLTIPLMTGIDLVLAGPQDFLAKPTRWMEWVSAYGGTCTCGPNFSYVLATRALRRSEGLDLSTLRVALNGAEPVDADAFRAFAAEGARFGLPPEALFPAFGMAEVCIAGVFPEPGAGMATDIIDGRVLEHEGFAAPVPAGHANARELAILGSAIPGLQIRVIDPTTGRLCREREVGELQISGTSLTSGYYRQPDATAELIVDGWLRTGDLAYLTEGRMVMCGRIKDVIIIGGRNIYPQDVEKVVGEVDGVRKGNVIAFGQEGRNSKQHIVVVAESRIDLEDRERVAELSRRITHAVGVEVGAPPREVLIVPPGTIPKTSSGKLQRAACRKSFEAGELAAVGKGADVSVDVRTRPDVRLGGPPSGLR